MRRARQDPAYLEARLAEEISDFDKVCDWKGLVSLGFVRRMLGVTHTHLLKVALLSRTCRCMNRGVEGQI